MIDSDEKHSPSDGEILKQIREKLGLTQHELASALGYSRPVVSNAERGHDISPRYLAAFKERWPDLEAQLENVSPTAARPRPISAQDPLDDDVLTDMFFRRADKTADLDGEWFALWETTANRQEVLNSERLVFKMKRDGLLLIQNVEISEENAEGGYLWIARGRLFDNQYILATYIPREPNVRSKGCMYLVLHRSGRFITGQWIGCNYDGDWARGLVVIARDHERLRSLLERHREVIPSMPYTGTRNTRSK